MRIRGNLGGKSKDKLDTAQALSIGAKIHSKQKVCLYSLMASKEHIENCNAHVFIDAISQM